MPTASWKYRHDDLKPCTMHNCVDCISAILHSSHKDKRLTLIASAQFFILHSSFFIELICLYLRSLANNVLSLKYVIYVFLSYILSVRRLRLSVYFCLSFPTSFPLFPFFPMRLLPLSVCNTPLRRPLVDCEAFCAMDDFNCRYNASA
jgi:hypothetical protein